MHAGQCYYDGKDGARAKGRELTPLVVRGSEGGTLFLNSPWLATDSKLLFADIFMKIGFWFRMDLRI